MRRTCSLEVGAVLEQLTLIEAGQALGISPDAMRPGEWLNGKLGALIREKQAGIVIVDTVEQLCGTMGVSRPAMNIRLNELRREGWL